ncbi:putative haloacid dehalogenase [Paenibacillus sp. 598K]|uniref:HAD family hydrolase n=1 Tax=Paenibacillus sp. 598K TaxID=1117987 RepID=UPI000FF98F69|nr:HAD family hydrolase [Paenibacillus sp. 598K]GBF73536.1 putative haloacid dehalogenase [Paenibacillus sp. 598K]
MYELTVNGQRLDIDAIVFDKDGTLLDMMSMWGTWSELMQQAFDQRMKQAGKANGAERLATLWGLVQDDDGEIIGYDRQGPMAMGTMGELYTLLAWEGYRAGLSWAEAKRLVYDCALAADEAMERARPARLIAGAEALLEQCRKAGIPMAVVTADETEAAVRHLDWLGLSEVFPVVVGTDQAEWGKPFPDLLLLACRQLGVSPERVAVIGDTNGDMMMGRAAGAPVRIALEQGADSGEGSTDALGADGGSLGVSGGSLGAGGEHRSAGDVAPGGSGAPARVANREQGVIEEAARGGGASPDSGASFPDATHIIRSYAELRPGSLVV